MFEGMHYRKTLKTLSDFLRCPKGEGSDIFKVSSLRESTGARAHKPNSQS